MSINGRIADLIRVLHDNENLFAKRIDVSTSVVFNVVNPKGRRSYPSGPVLEKILSIEKDGNRVSAEWLMRGEGNMFLEAEGVFSVGTDEIEETIEQLTETVSRLREGFEKFKKG
ncbi:MAG: hypothetical protein HEP71_09370 [Roseivirga sp.]|nr:hypothetical protein [Roseivirga sp.]